MDQNILDYFKNDELALSVWCNKYCHDNETPQEFLNRIKNEFNRLLSTRHENIKTTDNLSDFGKQFWTNQDKDYIGEAIQNGDIIPAGSVLSGAGTDKPVSLSNCFFNGAMEDNIDSIWDTSKSMAQIGKRRGGTSTDVSNLRPRGASVNNSSNKSSGAIEFLNLIDTTGKIIGQDGRKMAIMVTMDINHPDIEEFITVKSDLSKVTNANLSIKLNDEFIKAVKNNSDYILKWPCDLKLSKRYDWDNYEYGKLSEINLGYVKKVKAKELWDKIINAAHQYAEPGLLNWDKILNYDPTSVYDELKPLGTNPCSELPLGKLDSCRLICINLYNQVKNQFKDNSTLDIDKLYQIGYIAQVMGDILVDLEIEAVDRILEKINPNYSRYINPKNPYTEPSSDWVNKQSEEFKLWWKVREIGLKGRRTGIETTGYADLLAALGLPYGDPDMTESVYRTLMESQLDATIDMSILFGAFPLWDKSKEFTDILPYDNNKFSLEGTNNFYTFLLDTYPDKIFKMYQYGRRNSSWSTIGPCGTISLITKPNTEYNFPGLSSGIEPVFSLWYTRRKKSNPDETPTFIDPNGIGYIEYKVIHPRFKEWLIIKFPVDPDTLTDEQLTELAKQSPYWGQTAEEIDYHKRVETQASIQKYISSSISSTINLPEDTSKDVVSDIYLEAFEKGCKGITVYRSGSRSGILVKDTPKEQIIPTSRPEVLNCKILQFKNEKKDWIAFVGLLNDQPYELFTGPRDIEIFPVPSSITDGKIFKVKYDPNERSRYDFAYTDTYGYENRLGGLSRVFSQEYYNYGRFVSALLRGNYEISEIINIIDGLEFGTKSLNSWKSGVIRALKVYVPDGTEVKGEVCPECGGKLKYEGGCHICTTCGHSKCL